ncbi:MAG TPA: recombinase family protein [Solirubrobacterales bacterium]|nr:recombinase family protein [Solirubrobacterales bacterium]
MTGKVESAHLRRAAYVYVRQSTLAQVERNTESLERQYELVDRAVALGWAAGDVIVVDRDLGRSAKSTDGREGFEQLVADVGLGKVGIVLGIEVSRLARRNSDWYRLLDLCALTDTLIADADGVYHPGLHNDRLLLGLKGTMSEAELHVLRTRMREGALHKAAKGELRLPLPAGLDYDELGKVRITPDEAVADAIRTVFAYFEELSSARQAMLRLVAEERQLPRRGPGDRQVRWVPASYRAVHDILTNPCYAGVYAFGRKRVRRTLQDGVVRERVVPVPREEWHAFLVDHHPGFITLERYEANQARLRANWSPPRGEGGGAAREGRALLQGLVRCGRCGRKMQVGYSGRSLSPRYCCTRARGMYGKASCQSVGGRRIERQVQDAVFEALAPAAIDATLRAMEQLTDAHHAHVHSAELELERARQDADRARRQYDRCEPENRLVARTLESEWERQLGNVHRAEQQLSAIRVRRPEPLSEEEIAWCRRAGADLGAVFDAPTTTDRERKLLLRAMIAEVVLTVEREQQRALVRILWEGGAVTEYEVTLPRAGSHAATDQDTLELVRRLAKDYPDHQIAGILARQGRMTGAGKPFTAHRVRSLRNHHKIPPATPRTPPPGTEAVTVAQAAKELGVSTATVHRWLREGFIAGEQMTRNAPWQIHITPELRQRVCQHAPDGWLPLGDAAAALGLARQTVLQKVQRADLAAVYVRRGKRKGLRIQVKPSQAGLFENDTREEKQC